MLERTSKPGWERFEQGFLALCVFLAVPIGLLLSFSYEPGIRFLVAISTSLFLLGLAYSLHARSLHSRQAYLPGLRWLTSTALLALLVLLEICTTPLLLAFVFHPCSAFDLLRRANGCAARLPQASTVVSVSLSGDGSTLATADLEGAVSVWSYPDLIPVRTFEDRWPGIVRVALSAGGDRIAVGGHAPSISVLEPQTGELLYTLDEADTAVLFTHEDVSVLLSLAESAVKVWDAESGDLVRSLPHAGVEHLTVASDGGLLASGDSRQVKVWTLKDGTLITTFSIPAAHALRTLALAPDGGSLITVAWELDASTGAKNTVLTYWDILEGSPMYSVTLSDLLLDQIAISPQGGYLVGGTSRCSLGPLGRRCAYLWNRGDPLTTATLYTPAVTSLAFAPQGELVIGSHDELYVWRIP